MVLPEEETVSKASAGPVVPVTLTAGPPAACTFAMPAGGTLFIDVRTGSTPDATHTAIVEVRGPDGGAPYVVRFDDGHESIVYPGGDVVMEHSE